MIRATTAVRGKRQRRTDEQGRYRLQPRNQRQPAETDSAEQNLYRAKPKDVARLLADMREREMQPDIEQQENDTKLGEDRDRWLSANSANPLAFSAIPRTRYPTIGLSATARLATTAKTLSASRTMTGASACSTISSVIARCYAGMCKEGTSVTSPSVWRRSVRNPCNAATTCAPSPTAAATRLTDPARTSPIAKMPLRLVSSRSRSPPAVVAGQNESLRRRGRWPSR